MKALWEVFYRPGTAFERLPGARGAWILPMLLNALLIVGITVATPHFIGRENLMRQQLESAHLSPDVLRKALEDANSPAAIYRGCVFSFVAVCVGLSMVAGALMAFGMMTRQPPGYQTMLSMVSVAFLPYCAVLAILTLLVLVSSPDPSHLDAANPIGTNPAAFMDRRTVASGVYHLLSSLDILSFGELGLLALGFSRVTRSGILFGLAATVGLWILYVSVKTGISLVF